MEGEHLRCAAKSETKASRDKCIDAHDSLFSLRKGDSDLDPVAWNPQNRREALTTSISRQDTYGTPALTILNHYHK